jgi:YD repeat-containing protein
VPTVVAVSANPWEGSLDGLNTFNGNKQTSVPIVGWTQRGGLPISLVLNHNSRGTHNSELGSKWTHSLDIYALVDGATGNVTVHWGDDQCVTFTKNINGSYSPPAGFHDTLVANGSPISSYDLTTKGQVTYRFSTPHVAWYCTSISDRNGNAATLSYNSQNFITSIQDCTGRTLTFNYTVNKLTSVTDPLSRTWSFSGSGPLSQITYPAVGGSTYTESFGYNGANDITSITDRRGNTAWSATYNIDDSLATETDGCSNTTSYCYTSGQTVITDANSHTIKHNYTSGKLSSVEDQAGVSESYSYDSDLNRTGVTDRRGHSWSYTFDSAGNVLTKTDGRCQ